MFVLFEATSAVQRIWLFAENVPPAAPLRSVFRSSPAHVTLRTQAVPVLAANCAMNAGEPDWKSSDEFKPATVAMRCGLLKCSIGRTTVASALAPAPVPLSNVIVAGPPRD